MNKTEFNTWMSDFAVRFPSRYHWLQEGRAPEEFARLQKTWLQALDDVSLEDCTAALVMLQRGDVELPKGGTTDDVPGAIRKHARQFARDRRAHREMCKDRQPIEKTGERIALGGIFRELERMHESGATEDEKLALLNRKFPAVPPEKQPRFDCGSCFDVGFITIWSYSAVKAAIDGLQLPRSSRTEVARCNKCDRGRPKGKRIQDVTPGYKGPIETCPAFDPMQMLNVVSGDAYSESAIARLHVWLESQKETGVNSKRHREFDAFNRGEF